MYSVGFGWLANGNDDMTNYVLSAQQLLKHGLLTFFDLRGLAQGRDYATVLASLHLTGARPGSDMLLAFVSRVVGRPPYQVFMPVILALNLCGASAVGALTMQFARRWWAAVLAAGLLLVSPQATYAVLQQLVAQVWGLGVAAALLALLMRPELHSGAGARAREIVPIGVLATGLVLGYVEVVPELGLAYLAYVAILAVRRQVGIRALVRLWLPALAIALVVLNSYFFTELGFLQRQAKIGLQAIPGPPLFGFILVPSGLPSVFGLQTLPPGFDAPHLDLTIVLAGVTILGVLIGSLISAGRGAAAALVLVVEGALGVLLVSKSNDFGLFKLTMYVQPFLAATVAIWVSGRIGRWAQAIATALLVVFVAADLSTQSAYVRLSRQPGDVPNLSASDVIPAFHRFVTTGQSPVVSVTENPVLIKLEAASAGGRPVYFQSRNVFSEFLMKYAFETRGRRHAEIQNALKAPPWVSQSFNLMTANDGRDPFEQETSASHSLASGHCQLVLPSASEVPFNRYSLPVPSADLVTMPCRAPRDLLAFTQSHLGQSFYIAPVRKDISFFQQQGDPFFPGTMVGFGRYALFQVLGPTAGERMVVELTNTLTHDGQNRLPPANVVGSSRLPLPLEGRGSARVFSPPLKPQMIAGTPYVMLDMGIAGRLPKAGRTGVENAYGRSVPLDPRFLTSYLRDVSLVSAAEYAGLRPPLALRSFPSDLENPGLEYSGLYEDGWMGGEAYVRLAGGPATDLVVEGQVPAGAGKHLELLVNGRRVASVAAPPGPLDVRAPVPASHGTRRVELRFAATVKLKPPDGRPASALLSFLGFVAPSRGH
jgi:hypothetical protein